MSEYIVIAQYIVTTDAGKWVTESSWDDERFPTREQAISHGFKLHDSDDFNIGIVEGDRLVWFGWMDREIPEDLPEVAERIGLIAAAV